MKFQNFSPRPNWRAQANELGYLSSLLDDPPYWIEAAEKPFCASVTMLEVEGFIEAATEDLVELALECVNHVCTSNRSDELFDQLRIPKPYREAIKTSWARQDRSLYGRFDFAYSDGEVKLLELNFDTPTSLYEAAVLQWCWYDDNVKSGALPEGSDQFNSIHERLIDAFKKMKDVKLLHLSALADCPEDEETVRYLESCAAMAGISTDFLYVSQLGFDPKGNLVDMKERVIRHLFKLYPWEFLMQEDETVFQKTGARIFPSLIETKQLCVLEPVWKAILSNKAILPIMWEIAPNHANLLATSYDNRDRLAKTLRSGAHVRKPIFGREGANVSIVIPGSDDLSFNRDGPYGSEGFILQEYQPLPSFGDYHCVIGSWVIDGQPAGMGIRADKNAITGNTACFIPHFIEPEAIRQPGAMISLATTFSRELS